MFGPSLTKLLQYSWVAVVTHCLPMWVFNIEHGEANMHGWLFQQGTWGWGCAITWHIIDLGLLYDPYTLETYTALLDDPTQRYYWVAYLWKWSKHTGAWESNLILSDGGVQGADVEPWMVHTDGWW